MRGFHDEMGGPDSVASPSEWGPLSFGDDGMTAAGLPASPGAPSALPSEDVRRRVLFERGMRFLREQPSEDTLRHNFLLRRHLTDPGYGASRELSWREKCANGLGVASVPAVPRDPKTRAMVFAYRAIRREAHVSKPSPSE